MHRIMSAEILLIAAVFSMGYGWQKSRAVEFTERTAIPRAGEKTLLEVGMVAVGETGIIYVTEKIRQTIHCYAGDGKYIASLDSEQRKAARFRFGPYRIAVRNNRIASVDVGTSSIKFFDRQLTYLGQQKAEAVVMDIEFSSSGVLYASLHDHDPKVGIVAYYPDGTLKRAMLQDFRGGSIYDLCNISLDARGNIVIAYKYRNIIVVLDERLHQIAHFSVPGLPDSAAPRLMKLANEEEEYVPAGEIFVDVAVDPRGNIFLLGGTASNSPNQTTYVIDMKGRLLCTTLLPRIAGVIHIDKRGYLYTREENKTRVRKYSVRYEGSW
jgi:hypothetical protein